MAFKNPVAGGEGGVLIRDSIRSANYVPGSTGWIIDRTGTAEFRNVIVEGTIVLQPGQVTNNEISDVAVNKVTSGTTQFDWTVGARIKTADTGTRVELTPSGLQAFNGSTQTVDISAITGNVSILGQLLSGNSGLRLVVNPSGSSTPQIRWYPNSGNNYSQIQSSGTLFPGEATLTITSGINAANTASARFIVAAGFIGAEINDETGLVTNGGSFDIAESYIATRYESIAGTGGALFYGDGDEAVVGVVSTGQVSKGGMLRVEDSRIILRMESSVGSNDGGILYQDSSVGQFGFQRGSDYTYFEFETGRYTSHYGRWYDFADFGNNQGIFAASVVMTDGATSGSWSYGTTKLGQIIPIYVVRDNVVHSDALTASTTSGATVTISPAASGAWSVYLWGFQI